MCGICGVFSYRGDDEPLTLKRLASAMAERVAHRGPDDQGDWMSSRGNCAFAHRRLAVIEPGPEGHQPMSSQDGRYTIVFNGEIYNHRELRSELASAGATFRGRSDTEVLLQAYVHYGHDVCRHLDGQYAFAVFDETSCSLFLARDPFGEKPLYWMDDGRRFAFASELHCLNLLPFFDDTIDVEAVAEYLCLQYVDAPRTIYRNARKLEPAGRLVAGARGTRILPPHFHFEPVPDEESPYRNSSLDELADELEELLLRSLERRLIADVPLGTFLSGGIDSTLVNALLTQRLGADVDSFTIGFEGSAESEHEAAASIAEHLGARHHCELLRPDADSLIERAAELYDEPNGDTSCLPTWHLARFARKRVTVAVSGDGGDELFGGYNRYLDMLDEEDRHRAGLLPGWSAGRAYISQRLLFLTPERVAELFGYLPEGLAFLLEDLSGEVERDGHLPLLHRIRRHDTGHYLPGAVLAKVDRMTMRHALETRTPFLERSLAEFASRLPAWSLVNRSRNKLVLRRLAERYVPSELIDGPKRGFGIPAVHWADGRLLERMSDIASSADSRLSAFIERKRLAAFVEKERAKSKPAVYPLWAMAVLESWLRGRPHRPEAASQSACLTTGSRQRARLSDGAALEQARLLAYLQSRKRPVLVLGYSGPPAFCAALGLPAAFVGPMPLHAPGNGRNTSCHGGCNLDDGNNASITESIARFECPCGTSKARQALPLFLLRYDWLSISNRKGLEELLEHLELPELQDIMQTGRRSRQQRQDVRQRDEGSIRRCSGRPLKDITVCVVGGYGSGFDRRLPELLLEAGCPEVLVSENGGRSFHVLASTAGLHRSPGLAGLIRGIRSRTLLWWYGRRLPKSGCAATSNVARVPSYSTRFLHGTKEAGHGPQHFPAERFHVFIRSYRLSGRHCDETEPERIAPGTYTVAGEHIYLKPAFTTCADSDHIEIEIIERTRWNEFLWRRYRRLVSRMRRLAQVDETAEPGVNRAPRFPDLLRPLLSGRKWRLTAYREDPAGFYSAPLPPVQVRPAKSRSLFREALSICSGVLDRLFRSTRKPPRPEELSSAGTRYRKMLRSLRKRLSLAVQGMVPVYRHDCGYCYTAPCPFDVPIPEPAAHRQADPAGDAARPGVPGSCEEKTDPPTAGDSPASETGRSFALFEDGIRLGGAASQHEDIRRFGMGRYSVWKGTVYFSSSDGSSPNENGRRYVIVPEDRARLYLAPLADSVVSGALPSLDVKEFWTRLGELAAEERTAVAPAVDRDKTGRLALLMNYIKVGGAEKQWLLLATELLARGYEVFILTFEAPPENAPDLAHLLPVGIRMIDCSEQAPLPVPTGPLAVSPAPGSTSTGETSETRPSNDTPGPCVLPAPGCCGGTEAAAAEAWSLLASMPPDLAPHTWRFYLNLIRLAPDAVISQLDSPNTYGGAAALLAGVPRILLSVRNLNPTNFPSFCRSWFHAAYRALARSPRIVFSGNSRACCRDYARWIGIEPERFSVVPNCLDPAFLEGASAPASEAAPGPGLSGDGSDEDGDPIVLGVFRLSPEKDPFLFVDVAERVLQLRPSTRFRLAGGGDLFDELRACVSRRGLEDRIELLGTRKDIRLLMEQATIFLLTSKTEGIPNVLLEAQAMGLPIVSTRVGGVTETVIEHETALLADQGDAEALARHCIELLEDLNLRRAMSARARSHARRGFTPQDVTDRLLETIGLPPERSGNA